MGRYVRCRGRRTRWRRTRATQRRSAFCLARRIVVVYRIARVCGPSFSLRSSRGSSVACLPSWWPILIQGSFGGSGSDRAVVRYGRFANKQMAEAGDTAGRRGQCGCCVAVELGKCSDGEGQGRGNGSKFLFLWDREEKGYRD